ncbi:MAG: DUF3108 domain-containing protein [Bacteroidota bacterium]
MRTIFLIGFLCCWTLFVGAQSPLRQVENTAFQKGEFLKYRIHYGIITAGYATLSVKPKTYYIHDRACHHIVMRGFTHAGFDWFYKVRDVYETYFDESALVPWRFNRHIVEGSYESYTETHFNHYQQSATYINQKKEKIEYTVPDNIQDVISAYYYARTFYDHQTLKPGDKISLRNFLDQKTFGLEAVMLKREVIEVEDKEFKAIKFKLLIDESGLVTDGSTIVFWISDDFNKVPLRIESELVIGSLRADLIEWKQLLYPLGIAEEQK